MRTVLAAAASVALLAAPLALTPSLADAQSRGGGGGYHGGGGGGGGFRSGGGNGGGWSGRGASSPSINSSGGSAVRSSGGGSYRGGASYARGRYAGGYRGYSGHRGYYGYGGYPYFYGGLGLGIALGATYAYNDPWFYGYDGYYGGGYGAPYVISDRQTYVTEAPPPADYGPDGAYALQNQRPQANAPTGTACGAWKWDESETTYHWIPC
jgi:hypothetical protein